MKKLLVIGQTPPPYHGQALMTERLIKAKLPGIKIYFIRLAFSKDIHNIGKAGFKKVFHLLEVIARGIYISLRYNVNTIYYMPAGPNRTPVFRDMAILGILRRFIPASIFHFRAAGLSDFIQSQPSWFHSLAYWVYRYPNAAIQLSSLNPADGKYFKAKNTYILPNGLEDQAEGMLSSSSNEASTNNNIVHILFVGMLSESKGVKVLLEAINLLKDENVKLHIVGEFTSAEFEQETKHFCKKNKLDGIVLWEGVLHGKDKWEKYLHADIFCFPSFYESESFGNVVVEAMMFKLPVVASNWRGIPDIVVDGTTGWLVPPRDVEATANKLRMLIQNPLLRKQMGEAGRQRYLEKYRLEIFLTNMHKILLTESQA
ncbi:glycosyltransferase involved in cell wall biosynthesis [Catalinimonas alkaloidigena]|uniref:glycosyltransferase n=1 Tax=Catalinimonas alkaloidigena TaxID=1075417 RepID=UPI00240582C6|nr:glycosyltransferase [Catalinimonas alkaloidigena]MDF9799665.1 glycosyltransferase involved in cell wall biosynthesis [Catalinimonas alkaloidigena]